MAIIDKYEILLASKSPRRKEILKQSGIPFKLISIDVDETYPDTLSKQKVAEYLANKKAQAVKINTANHQIILTCDTVVVTNDEILNKPADKSEAIKMLSKLSNTTHRVITGVCLKSNLKTYLFSDTTTVTFKELLSEEINYYIEKFNPLDKAGAYGIQEWIGLIGVTEINGSYHNVVGLPINKIYEALNKF
jgi:septum formation protein